MRRIKTVGLKKNRLLVLSEQGKYVFCRCDCGNEKQILRVNFLAGYTKSCGCYQAERVKEVCSTHGLTGTPIYNKWKMMRRRCEDPAHEKYIYYGGRGVTVCVEWSSFENFYADMGASFKKGLSLDRIDNSKGYSIDNCRWVTLEENHRHKG